MLHRRAFLEIPLKGTLWLGATATGLGWLGPVAAAPVPDLAVVRGDPAKATRAAVDMLGGMTSFVKPGQQVVIKPNMSFVSPAEFGANTHPLVVRELAAMCWEAGASSVLSLDHTLGPARSCLEGSGISAALESVKPGTVHAVSDRDLYVEVDLGGTNLPKTEIITEVLRADVLIAAPTAKSHSGTGVSAAIKGMMGLVYNRRPFHWDGLDECIVDLGAKLNADLTVIDATHVLSSNGPSGPGEVLNEGKIIASRDMVAADAFTVAEFPWYGQRFAASQVGHIKLAHERGLGRMDFEKLDIKRVDL